MNAGFWEKAIHEGEGLCFRVTLITPVYQAAA